MPSNSEDYTNFLDSQQRAAAEQAAKKGTPINTREMALSNLAGRFESPHEALKFVASVNTKDVDDKTRLEGLPTLNPTQQKELDEVNARLRAGDAITSDVLKQIDVESQKRKEEYAGKPFNELTGIVSGLNSDYESAKRALDQAKRARKPANEIGILEDRAKTAEFKLNEARSVYDRRAPGEAQNALEDQLEQEEQEAEARKQENEAMPLDKLRDKTVDLYKQWNALNANTRKINRTGTTEEKAQHAAQKNELYKRWKEANDAVLEKEQAEEKRTTEENEKVRRETGTVADLTVTRDAAQVEVTRLRTELENADLQLNLRRNSGAGPDELAKAYSERNKLASQLGEANKTLAAEQDALSKAEERRRTETGTSDLPSLDNIRNMSVKDFEALSTTEQTKYLNEIARNMDDSLYNFNTIAAAVEAGHPVTIEQRAFFAKQVAERMARYGYADPRGYDARHLVAIGHQYPEITNMIFDRLASSDQIQQRLRERFPTYQMGRKMLEWARQNPQFLLILLMVLGGAVMGPASSISGIGSFLAR